MCYYTPSSGTDHAADTVTSPTKRRHLDMSPPSIHSALESAASSAGAAAGEVTSPHGRGGGNGGGGGGDPMQGWEQQVVMKSEQQQSQQHQGDLAMGGVTTSPPPLGLAAAQEQQSRQGSLQGFKKLPSRNNANGAAEETNIYTETRMLQDQTGRLRGFP